MELAEKILFFVAGFLSFYTYRAGIKDKGKSSRLDEMPPTYIKGPGIVSEEVEKDFFNEYSKLMNYDFEKVGESDG